MTSFSVDQIPSQAGRFAIVTGANSGIGYETALALALAGADVVVASRNPAKGEAAVARIQAAAPGAKVAFRQLDLADLASVRRFAEAIAAERPAIDLLVNNAGVMAPEVRLETKDGFELQFGTNYLGHFALTAHLLPLLRQGNGPRVVHVSSIAARRGRIAFDDLQHRRRYRPFPVYGQSKLANLMFALELQRRSDTQGWGLMSIGAHPGVSATDLIANKPTRDARRIIPLIGQSQAAGALPILFAATAPEARGAGYYGPNGFFELKGAVTPARIVPRALDPVAGARLWDVSQELTRIRFG
jgi:NAD(P)-dependent dehydrogenase (short-subunit alcohol dehydrogenase family)